jgi:uncharacterized protein (TIGR02271 family)
MAMAYEKIVAFYDGTEKARQAAHALEGAGFAASDISLLNRESLSDKEIRDGSTWQRLFGRSISDQESTVYRRAIDSGGAVLTLRAADTEVDRAMKILNGHGPKDLYDRSGTSLTSAAPRTGTARTDLGEEQVLRLAEEQLDVGKRQVATGKSRIRRFVIEKPVEQQVTLHEEHCEVARRAVTDPKLAQDIDWKDQTLEVTETSEQAVVSKTARIAEEVVIRRRGSDRVETVRDTVRRQQIEVERVPDVRSDLKKAA